MLIYIFGKSGSGKSYLAKYLSEKLNNSIHIDIDELNHDLIKTPNAINYALNLFGDGVLNQNKIDKLKLLNEIINDNVKYLKWHMYMLKNCEDFLKKYIEKTSFDYYIIDHLNAGKFELESDCIVKIECVLDYDIRLKRLKDRDSISKDILDFRDQKYESQSCDIVYDGDVNKVLEFIQSKSQKNLKGNQQN